MPARPQIAPTKDWRQIELLARAPGQRTYELVRPVVLFGQSAAERAAETGAAERTLYRQAARFDQLGMASLVPPPKVEKHRLLPAEVHQTILDAKREHPPLNVLELTTICWARYGHRPSSHTVKRILAESPPPPRTHRRFLPNHAIADPSQRRLAIVRLHVEGWNATSIAAYLETSRQTVHATLKRRAEEEFARLGIFLSPRTCGRILALNRKLSGLPKPEPVLHDPKPMPFKAVRRHQYWSADIRRLDHGLGDFKVYAVTILDNDSRAVLASGLSRTQDLGTFLMVLFMAIQQHGAPEGLVTDGGSIFRAKQLLTVLDRLGVAKHEIAPRQAWQNDVEALFGVQRRMADWGVPTPDPGPNSSRFTTSGSPTTTTRTTSPIRSDRRTAGARPRCSTGCAANALPPRSSIASSPARASAACWIGQGMRGSGGGGSMPSAAWAGSRWRCGCMPSTSPSSIRMSRWPSTAWPTNRTSVACRW